MAGEAVFYAGDGAKAAAQSFAKANGKATLVMRLGKSLYSFLKLFGSDINSEAFNILSTNFAKGSSGSNTIFIGNYVNSY